MAPLETIPAELDRPRPPAVDSLMRALLYVARQSGRSVSEAELRDCGLFRPTKFPPACETCEDTGYMDRTCWDRHRCQRETCVTYPERQHSYVEPCHCPKGDRFRVKVRSSTDELASVGKVAKKKTGWRQVGA